MRVLPSTSAIGKLIALSFPVFMLGCGPAAPPSTAPQATGSAAEQVAEPVVDNSLTSAEYIHLGFPSPDREWSEEDLAAVEKVLASLVSKGYGELPRFGSKRSGEVFARMNADSNLDLFRNSNLPIEARIIGLNTYQEAQLQILKLYMSGFIRGEVSGSEMVELVGSQMRGSALTFVLIEEFLPTIDKNDPTYPVRMQGLKRMKSGAANVVMGTLQMLTERPSYRPSDLQRLVGYMQESFPVLVPHLTESSRAEAMIELQRMQTDPKLQDLQPGLGELLEKLKGVSPIELQ